MTDEKVLDPNRDPEPREERPERTPEEAEAAIEAGITDVPREDADEGGEA